MIALFVGFLAGILGWFKAAKQGGSIGDKFQYAFAFGLVGFVLTLLFSVLYHRMVG
jgi:hypothetical protein